MKQPYSFDLKNEYPKEFAWMKLPIAVIGVNVNNEFCCHAGVTEEGVMDLDLPKDVYAMLGTGEMKMTFPRQELSDGRGYELMAIDIMDAG